MKGIGEMTLIDSIAAMTGYAARDIVIQDEEIRHPDDPARCGDVYAGAYYLGYLDGDTFIYDRDRG